MQQLLLIRHGESEWNRDQRVQGQADCLLSTTGVAQAARIAAALRDMPVHRVFTSDLERAWRTAEIIVGDRDVPVVRDRRLRESGFGAWEGLAVAEVKQRFPTEYAAWRADSVHNRPPDGETVESILRRVGDLLHEVEYRDGENVLLVGHAGSIRAAIAVILGGDIALWGKFAINNCSISRTERTADRWWLRSVNESSHLQADITDAGVTA